MDFVKIRQKVSSKNGTIEVYPEFVVKRSKDIMIRGKNFYAIWDEENNIWSTDEYDVQRLVDKELYDYAESIKDQSEMPISVRSLSAFSSRSWTNFKNYISSMSDSYHPLDNKIIFSNTDVRKEDYASKRMPYPLEACPIPSYEKLISTLYLPKERAKIEWAIGAVISGDAKNIQKFLVFYGDAGAGKSTVLNIIQQLFDGYTTSFEAKALVTFNNAFATEVFKDNPLVAIQHDGDLSRIEDNTKLNSIVSHELMTMNEKYKSSYTSRINCFLFMATNKPVKITDAKSGIIRRLIDVKPSGEKLKPREYQRLVKQIPFELGGIAKHCLDVYEEMGPFYYDDYIPIDMIYKTDFFFNFVESYFSVFAEQSYVTLAQAYDMYRRYCDESAVSKVLPRYVFREELKNYFDSFDEQARVDDGKRIRSVYRGFREWKINGQANGDKSKEESVSSSFSKWLKPLADGVSIRSRLELLLKDCPAQYANEQGLPKKKWENVQTKLKDISTDCLHYVQVPANHIVIDFDLKDENGEKSLKKNLEAASKWPETYAELSKSGAGVHLHYIYTGDPSSLSCVYSEGIEVKVFGGNSALRRKLTSCNDADVATINSGLPLKEKKVINFEAVKNERQIRSLIKKGLAKEVWPGTKPSIDFICHILDEAYETGVKYDVSDMQQAVILFASRSTHHPDYCLAQVTKMHFKSDEPSDNVDASEDAPFVFFDCEVFPNLFLVNWKYPGEDKKCVRMVNPSSQDVEMLFKFKLIGFNCRRYDNHILYGRYLGLDNGELYALSQRIINGDNKAMYGEAYNISYADVYDFSAKKQSLKKWEIELGIHHQELGFPWDEPVPEDKWIQVAEYCDNDVIATEAVFNACRADFVGRELLADISKLPVNATTRMHAEKIIFGDDKNPQSKFVYTDLSTEFPGYTYDPMKKSGKSQYRGEDPGEGGYVYAEPGMYFNVALLDVASMHPSSMIALNIFGDEYTKKFKELLDLRIALKHGDLNASRSLCNGVLAPYLDDQVFQVDDLVYALKIVINSVYGLTAASFENRFRDPRNVDNIVAKRGALFMINLKHEVQDRGFTVAHIKTDSIKIPDATPEIIDFVMEYGKKYGYVFEHQATYSQMCLVNDAVYVARYLHNYEKPELDGTWTATGAQFQQPYVFKTLFSKKPIEFKDMCETKTVTSSMYLDCNEDLPNVEAEEKEKEARAKLAKQKPAKLNQDFAIYSDSELDELIARGHDYKFVGRAGLFCPVKPGCNGGLLVRKGTDGKYSFCAGTKGYRWLESEVVKTLGLEEFIDRSYYNRLVDEAKDSISQYGDFDVFANNGEFELPF